MKLVSHGSFDSKQQALADAILRAIRGELEKVDAHPEMIEQLTGSIGFAVTAILDDSRAIEVEGKTLSPVLTFLVVTMSWSLVAAIVGCTSMSISFCQPYWLRQAHRTTRMSLNMPIATDPKEWEAASPQPVVVRQALR